MQATEKLCEDEQEPLATTLASVKIRRLTTKLSDGEMNSQHAGAEAIGCACGPAARGQALYAKRRSLQRLVRRRYACHEALPSLMRQPCGFASLAQRTSS